MKTTLYLIRHGESAGNAVRAFLGHTDLDITQKGHIQAQMTAQYLNEIYTDAIYSSDLIRAYNTAMHTARLKNMPIIKDEGLREIYAGEWENVTFDELEERYAEDFALWKANVGRARPTGGESVLELQKRIAEHIEDLAKQNEGKTIFLFTHATPIRTFKAYVENILPDNIKDFPWPSNASVSKFEYEDGKFKLLSYSEDSFMGDLVTALPPNV